MSKSSMTEFYQQHIASQIDHAGALSGASGDQMLQQMLDAEQKFSPFLRLFVHVTEHEWVQYTVDLLACICGTVNARKAPWWCNYSDCYSGWPQWD